MYGGTSSAYGAQGYQQQQGSSAYSGQKALTAGTAGGGMMGAAPTTGPGLSLVPAGTAPVPTQTATQYTYTAS